MEGFNYKCMDWADTEEAMRRALEACGSSAGIPCTIVAVDDSFVVRIATTMKVVGFFRAGNNAVLAPEVRDDVARRIGSHKWLECGRGRFRRAIGPHAKGDE
jgi:hypothetical protein